MKRFRKIMAFILLAAVCMSLCACSDTDRAESTPAGEYHNVTDYMGRGVAVPDDYDSIACLYAYTGHVCAILGCEDKISAVVSGLKRDALMRVKLPDIDSMPSPYSSGSVNIEELAAVSPDIIFIRKSLVQNEGEKAKLDGLGIPYLVVEYDNMDQQLESIRLMGSALGAEERAEAYIKYYEDMIGLVRERVSAVPEEERKTVYHSVNEAVRTDVPGTLSYEVLDAAGCVNAVGSSDELRLDGDKGYVTVEQIYVWDPDVLLVNEADAVDYFKNDAKFSGLRAVREGSVIELPVGISRWGHPGSVESPLAALFIAKTLYPEQFEDISMEDETKNFYSEFLDLELSDDEIRMILSGRGMRAGKGKSNG